MSTHRILRQVIELDGCPPGADAALRSQLGALAQRHLQPVIERACEALDAPGRLWRVERLTLDLGSAPLGPDPLRPADEDWGRQLAERLEACLAPALTEALQATDPRQADLELLAQFIATGGVPWWADLQDRQLLTAALRRVLDDLPALQSLGLVQAGAAWQRLVACAGDAGAADWLDALLDDDSARALWRPWRDALADVVTQAGGGASALRSLWWSLALPAAVRGRLDARGLDPAALAAALVAAWPGLGAQAMAGSWLWPAWRRAFDRRLSAAASAAGGAAGPTAAALGTGAAPWWRALDDPAVAVAAAGRAPAAGTASATWLDWLRHQAADQPAGSLLQRLLAALVSAWPHLPARAREAACGRWAEPHRPDGLSAGAAAAGLPPTLDALAAPGWQTLADLLRAAARAGQLPSVLLEALRVAAAAPQPSPALAALQAAVQRAAASDGVHDAVPVDRRFADTDAIAVADAGLVLLWPFLPTFFARLGWLGEAQPVAGASPQGRLHPSRGFASPGLAARAVMLLHGLATGQAAPPLPGAPIAEHLLPLPKLLCGLAPEAPLPALAPAPAGSLSEAESDSAAGPGGEAGAEKGTDMGDDKGADTDVDAAREAVAWAWALGEGDRLLQAAIAQAPILREMSVPAFRASFVLRAGQLGVRDDHWLLRVERTAYDLVRDRFPWAVSVVRLPWMNATLQVEW